MVLNFQFQNQERIIQDIKESISKVESEIKNNVWWGNSVYREHFIKAHNSALKILETDKALDDLDIVKEYINYKENQIRSFIDDYENTLVAVGHCPRSKRNVYGAVTSMEKLEEAVDYLYIKTDEDKYSLVDNLISRLSRVSLGFRNDPQNLRPDIEKEIHDVVRGAIVQKDLLNRFLTAIQNSHESYCNDPSCKYRYWGYGCLSHNDGKPSNKKPRQSKLKETVIDYLINDDMFQLLNHWNWEVKK